MVITLVPTTALYPELDGVTRRVLTGFGQVIVLAGVEYVVVDIETNGGRLASVEGSRRVGPK